MAISNFAQASRQGTDNTGYNAVFIQDSGDKNRWYLKTEEHPDHTYSVTLDGVDYDIRLRWNTRDESWQMFIGISGETPAVTFKVVNGFDLLRPYKHLEAVPDGQLYLVDTVKINGRPGFYDTGIDSRFVIVYIDAEEDQN